MSRELWGLLILITSIPLIVLVVTLAIYYQEIKENIRMWRRRIRTWRIQSQIYRVSLTGKYDKTYIFEDDAKIPVELHKGVRNLLVELVDANPHCDVYMKAKVDPRTLKVLSVEGYTLKPKEEAE